MGDVDFWEVMDAVSYTHLQWGGLAVVQCFIEGRISFEHGKYGSHLRDVYKRQEFLFDAEAKPERWEKAAKAHLDLIKAAEADVYKRQQKSCRWKGHCYF